MLDRYEANGGALGGGTPRWKRSAHPCGVCPDGVRVRKTRVAPPRPARTEVSAHGSRIRVVLPPVSHRCAGPVHCPHRDRVRGDVATHVRWWRAAEEECGHVAEGEEVLAAAERFRAWTAPSRSGRGHGTARPRRFPGTGRPEARTRIRRRADRRANRPSRRGATGLAYVRVADSVLQRAREQKVRQCQASSTLPDLVRPEAHLKSGFYLDGVPRPRIR